MNKINAISILICFFLTTPLIHAQNWHPAGDKIKTQWAEKVDPSCPLPEYPRPILERKDWQNLNGLWDYSILPKGSAIPGQFDGKILVPFAVESSLSGVQKKVGPENELWYHREFSIPESWKNRQILLNFGAVDWKSDIWINDVKIGSHQGGYTPFSFNITPFLVKGQQQKIIIRVWDPADKSFQPRGKQVTDPHGIWYTSVTGIWQTVWLEPVGANHITEIRTIPDIDRNTVSVTANAALCREDLVEVKVFDGDKVIASGKSLAGQEVLLGLKDARLWTPESPNLYDLEVCLLHNGQVTDRVKSYFGMRKISTRRDESGVYRLQLNNKDYFQFGPLDQGWWPDGLYTAPTDEALKFDIVTTKSLGFNLIRKHVKVEPARWYYHCDREGILVWQDMPSGDRGPQWQTQNFFNGLEKIRTKESEDNFKTEWKAIIDLLISNPCVVTWVPFNESWGQFKTVEIAEWTKSYDPSRLVNPASGGNFYPVGDILDVHHYPDPEMTLYDGGRACVLGEYGGLGLVTPGHLWVEDRNWGYVEYKNTEELTNAYIELAKKLKKLVLSGFSAAIYTQTTDVEIEVNGLMTYDRKVIKPNLERIRKANLEVCRSLSGNK
ncbi:MAG: glycoside hydrolase family 2 TIM barrel-domain containing protein [Bacteroidales bacterium]|nr:glycoside hydrolase family 2 TIM barrel-domain containing protein [Bacteroidales bacterium]